MDNSKILVHVGVRPDPDNELELISGQKFVRRYFERYPEGGGRYWNSKLLNSGCNEVLRNNQERDGLIYCPTCDEWCNMNQYEELPVTINNGVISETN